MAQKELFDAPWLRNMIGRTFGFLSPNTWTTISLLLGFVAFATVVMGHINLAVLLFVVSGMCDFIDGRVARYKGLSSKFGAFWDGTVDRFVDALIIASFFFIPFDQPRRQIDFMLFVLLFATLLPPFIVAYANHRGAIPDPTEKVIWRFAFRAEPILLLGVAAVVNPVSRAASYVFLLLALALMLATVIQSIVLVFIRSKDYL